ncbi:MAG TPA: PQQ-binding-like beta-propeller repeat protein, partial [Anaerolineales bacterium]|nr:PQQ-binding-like beta-propeller repeat protein [Anaerolineales bacterium]
MSSSTPPTPDPSEITRPTRVAREGWGGCFALALSILGVIFCVGLAWGLVAYNQFSRPLDKYLSVEPGQSSLYRITYANGMTGFFATNTVYPNDDSISYATLQGGGEPVQVNIRATNWNGQPGQTYTREDYYLRNGNALLLLAQHTTGFPVEFSPPLVSWDSALLDTDAATPLTGQVTFNAALYDYIYWLDGRETVRLPDGGEVEALRVGLEFKKDGASYYRSTSWYAAGVGQVRGDDFDGNGNLLTHIELLTSSRLEGEVSLPLDELLAGASSATSFFREDATRIGAHPGTQLSDDPFQVAYHLTLEANFTASPVVADGRLFVADQDGTLFALDAKRASLLWRFGVGGAVVATPAVANGLVYVGGSDKTLYALTAQDGLFVWAFRLKDNVATSAVASDGVVFVGGEDRTLYALDALTGTERWRFTVGDRIVSSPAVTGGRVYFGSDEGLVYALDAATGAEIWRTALDEAIFASPAVADGVVYVGATGAQFAAMNAETGEILWQYESVFGYKASPAIGADFVFVASEDGAVRALRRLDGTEAWTWRTPDGVSLVSSPLLIGDRLVIVDLNGMAYFLNMVAGDLQSQIALTRDGVSSSPTWDGETIYLTTQDKQVFALRANEEASSPSLLVAWEFDFGGIDGVLYASPVWLGNFLYAVDHSGKLWRVDPGTGQGDLVAQWNQVVEATPAVDGNQLFVGTQTGYLFAFDVDRQTVIWQTTLAMGVRFAPLVQAGRIYVHAGDGTSGIVYAVDASSGQILWQVQTQGFGNSSPVLESGVLIVSGDRLIGLNPETGQEIWHTPSFVSYGGTTIQAGLVYAVGAGINGESVLAVAPATGEVRWESTVPDVFIFSRPALDVA